MLFKCRLKFKSKSDPQKRFVVRFAMRAGSFEAMTNKLQAIAQLPIFSHDAECLEYGETIDFERDDILYSHLCTYSKRGGFKGDFLTSSLF